MKRQKEVHRLDWRGIGLEVTYEPKWLASLDLAHIEVRSVEPAEAPLPITETGYRSHFADRPVIEEAGGPVAFVQEWLDIEAATPRWRRQEAAARQLSLF